MKKEKLLIKFLGTSSTEAIPREGCECPQCASSDRADKRLRSSILINKKILIDATPDVLAQLKPSQILNLDSLIITHEHDDHVGGLKHILRANRNIRIIRIKPGQHFKLFGIEFYAFKVEHSKVLPTVGLVIDDFIYIPDSASLASAMKYLKDVKYAILDGSSLGRSFGGHLSVNEIISTVKPLKNLEKIYFTHNGHTKKTHQEMSEIVEQLGDKRFSIAYDGFELKD
jgi:phosphoribosyl 1,2-cyclic phosphate phosphodiesterase